ncbi:hypothetical protein P153DRAFT_370491 [Dothidotthia symphoricarpi CBS 119687]|uniref:Origin recognition complex subunit 4 n=1 Tax=Dothidotthia symphoricarpi CBS 119687 TaxID=1392245 RepID=A0A6A6A1W5_9PLEO|nr:uncharacterized protein P153DRAFT_370491 [Dothidotthia symphoricarpi CBS 119687]KAF2125173.1 hypothetical protein P153DRAFT_370491 [Dothidotthia symphoricarpi CBS 119687]
MEDTPRSSKRRKLDTPKRTASSPLAKSSVKRASGRVANRSVSYAQEPGLSDVEEEEPTPKRSARGPKSTTNGPLAKHAAVEDPDIYDDIDGALGIQTSPRPTIRRPRPTPTPKKDIASSGDTIEVLEPVVAPPKRGRGRPRKEAVGPSQSTSRTLVSGHNNGANGEADEVANVSTPKKTKASTTTAASARKTPAPRASGRKKKAPAPAPEQDQEADEPQSGVIGTSPSKLRQKKRTASTIHVEVVPEMDEEAPAGILSRSARQRKPVEKPSAALQSEDDHDTPSSTRQTASARRRNNRADHAHNRADESSPECIEQVDGHDEDASDVDENSILDSMLDPTEPSPFNKPTSAKKEKPLPPLIYQGLAAGRELDLLKTILLERITGKRPPPLTGLDEEYKSVHQLVEQTITAGEGNSMLLIGARGSGKTALVNKVLAEVSRENGGEYHVVRLNGLIHTDDKIALREIWRQLGKEMDIEEDGSGPGKNYADTLTTLLALLSHPSEQTGELTEQVAKAVIFVMDEFDLFAQHPRQTLLYNLFDIAQSRKAPIAVLGLTTRIDVTNSLEKRVKSRFSHRYVHLSLAKTFTAFQEICKACLTVQTEQLSLEERGILQGGTTSTPGKKGSKAPQQNVLEGWNANIEKLFTSPSFLKSHLAPAFYRTKSVPSVLTTFFLPTALLSPTSAFEPLNLLHPPDAKLSLLPHLSTLALSLLIAAARLDIIHDSDTCNFNMAYDEYVTLASKARIQSAAGGLSASSSVSKVWGKDVARREWEGLVELALVMPVIAGQAGGFGMVRADVSLEEIGDVLKAEKERGLERWCRAI